MKTIRLETLQGFTLVEVMITVAIIGVLAMVVYPSYLEYVKKSYRVDARIALIELAQLQEDSFVTTKAFKFDREMNDIMDKYENDNYKLTLNDVNGFTLTATAIGNQRKDTHCSWFAINSIGNRTAENDDCW